MEVRLANAPAESTAADTIVVGAFIGDGVSSEPLQALLDSGEARLKLGSLALTHVNGRRLLLAGLGAREEFDGEAARAAAAGAAKRARELGARALCWEAPAGSDARIAAALVEGTILASYRFDRYRTSDVDEADGGLESLTICAADDYGAALARAQVIADAVNSARLLQDTPANDMTPTALADRARAIASEHDSLTVRVDGRKELVERGMGAFAAVAQGTAQEPALITLRYKGPEASGPVLGFVGKAVTFDSGGISLKPGTGMEEMKFDMSGGAAVIEAVGAIAELGLPVEIVAVVGATENLPSARAVKPGDIVRTMSGKTVEINNTDAEGRLVVADCLAHAIGEGAERLIDLATLTGAIIVALGSTYAGLMSNDDDWAAAVEVAGDATGELVWRMPLHPEYKKLVKGSYADLNNAPERGKAGSITAAEFLAAFAGDIPWAHIDIAGTAWNLGRTYAEKGGSGFGVRLLVELASASR
ncbi:MAG TPA: leucyl aminopeptidase [Solirubrobacteraceae bacterium]|jgi:leucyl aminopeptidase|nr:leucyl aminopeptidase [Solirubrobacteraceae bacterium]